MNFRILRLVFVILWFTVAGFFYYQGHQGPGGQNVGWFGANTYDLMAGFATLMAIWNLVRWYLSIRRPASEPENPLRRREPETSRRERVDEYHPEFDFGNPPRQGE